MCGDPLALFYGIVVAGAAMVEALGELSEREKVCLHPLWFRFTVSKCKVI